MADARHSQEFLPLFLIAVFSVETETPPLPPSLLSLFSLLPKQGEEISQKTEKFSPNLTFPVKLILRLAGLELVDLMVSEQNNGVQSPSLSPDLARPQTAR